MAPDSSSASPMITAGSSAGGSGLIAVTSPDSSLYALHVPPSAASASGSVGIVSSNKTRLSVRVYDCSTGSSGGGGGGLKQTLSATVDLGADGGGDAARLTGAAFSTSSHYLTASLSNHTALVWDLRRGVVVHSVSISASKKKKGGSGSGSGSGQRLHAVTCGSTGGVEYLYALASNAETGKLFLLEYGLDDGKLKRKIKCGSLDEDNKGGGGAVACSPDGKCLAVRTSPSEIRLIDASSGNKIAKCKIRSSGTDGSSSSMSILTFSDDSSLLAASTPAGVSLFSSSDGKETSSLHCDERPGSAALFLRGSGGGVALIAEPGSGCANIYDLWGAVMPPSSSSSSPSKKKKKKGGTVLRPPVLRPTATVKCADGAMLGAVCASFGRHRPGEVVTVLLVPDALRSKGKGAGAAARTVEAAYRNGNDLKTGDILIQTEENEVKKRKEDDDRSGKKRRAEQTLDDKVGNVVLGPGEGGGEALGASDRPPSAKKAKGGAEDLDDDDDEFQLPEDDEEDEREGGRTIAERLAALSSRMDDLSDDTDDDESVSSATVEKKKAKSKPPPVTSGSLAILLTQSLRSNDDARLEVALRANDARVVRNSVLGLMRTDAEEDDEFGGGAAEGNKGEQLIVTLLSKLVSRLARTPSRAPRLAVWLRSVLSALASGGDGDEMAGGRQRMGQREREVALSHLLPLRNLLNERVASLPDLMRLDGRLALLDGGR
eukprot:CAMPEP_0113589902 /NCGR_PEP_ID=MMETSP0015_2-20120614/36353_1 /TAXON_ID=2838 /ORGANISM="Odontella" /LENGTH=717 /DNA_ID=CAMNT_0000495987 /DNA_START=108 /DNA_END=2261 /DNA_ORIENTATION=- /assembly_acc=CAM_ASM_000160